MTTTNITYEPVENWAKMPLGISFYGDCGGVAVDSKDNVYVFKFRNHTSSSKNYLSANTVMNYT